MDILDEKILEEMAIAWLREELAQKGEPWLEDEWQKSKAENDYIYQEAIACAKCSLKAFHKHNRVTDAQVERAAEAIRMNDVRDCPDDCSPKNPCVHCDNAESYAKIALEAAGDDNGK